MASVEVNVAELNEFFNKCSRISDDLKKQLNLFLEGLGNEFLRVIQDEIISKGVVDTRLLLSSFQKGDKDNVWVLAVTGYDPYDLSLTGRTLSYVLSDILNVTEASLDNMIPNKGRITIEEWNEILDRVYKKNKIYLGLNRVV